MAQSTLRIGTRGSPLALAQAREVRARIAAARGLDLDAIELVVIRTSGDMVQDRPLTEIGGKGLFTKEIDQALIERTVDLAVHSAKDLPSEDPHGVEVAAVPQRGLPYDVVVSREVGPDRWHTIGTSSLRRRAQILRMHPHLKVHDLRGNVDTRLRRLAGGRVDALILAAAGLARLAVEPEHLSPLPMDEMVPAPGQGALALQAREGDPAGESAAAIDHPPSRTAFETERRVVTLLGGGCRLPLGAYAEKRGDVVRLLAVVVKPDGSDLLWAQVEAGRPEEAAGEAAEVLLTAGAAAILEDLRE
jgi:hydroxymethylbilane synthase